MSFLDEKLDNSQFSTVFVGHIKLMHQIKNMPLKIPALLHDKEKANDRYAEIITERAPLTFIPGDLEHIHSIEDDIYFIIHGSIPTASRFFADHPADTTRMNLVGAATLPGMTRDKQVESLLFMSSTEVYGSLRREEKVDEDHESFVNTMNPRRSYSEAKRMVESNDA